MSIDIHFLFLLKTSHDTLDLKFNVIRNLSNMHTAKRDLQDTSRTLFSIDTWAQSA